MKESKIKIIKNCLSKENHKEIKNIIYSDYFAWYLNFGVNYIGDGNKQFTHTFYDKNNINSDFFKNLKPIIDLLNPSTLLRIKANLLTKTSKIIRHEYHADQSIKSTTAIFYVNTNNGYTKFENGKKINSEENKLIIFDNFLKYAGTTCTAEDERIIINFNNK